MLSARALRCITSSLEQLSSFEMTADISSSRWVIGNQSIRPLRHDNKLMLGNAFDVLGACVLKIQKPVTSITRSRLQSTRTRFTQVSFSARHTPGSRLLSNPTYFAATME